MEEAPRAERKLQGIERKLTQKANSLLELKSVPLIDFTYVCNIIGGIIKEIQIEFRPWRNPLVQSENCMVSNEN